MNSTAQCSAFRPVCTEMCSWTSSVAGSLYIGPGFVDTPFAAPFDRLQELSRSQTGNTLQISRFGPSGCIVGPCWRGRTNATRAPSAAARGTSSAARRAGSNAPADSRAHPNASPGSRPTKADLHMKSLLRQVAPRLGALLMATGRVAEVGLLDPALQISPAAPTSGPVGLEGCTVCPGDLPTSTDLPRSPQMSGVDLTPVEPADLIRGTVFCSNPQDRGGQE